MRRRTRLGMLVVLSAMLASGFWLLGRGTPSAGDWFEDKTAGSGLQFCYRNDEEAGLYTLLESLGGGVALLDYDKDGLLDVFVTGGGYFTADKEIRGYPNRLFHNEGNWRFRDVTKEVGLPTEGVFYSHGCAVGDYNNDGWPDLLVTGYGRMALYRNDRGKFTEVTKEAGLLDSRPLHWSTSAAWADLNGDGHLDLFVCHYTDWSFANDPPCTSSASDPRRDRCPPERFQPLMPALYINQGDGTFREADAATTGLVAGSGLGVLIFDLNDDGKLDIYVANDSTGNHLYRNKGGAVFEEIALRSGVALSVRGEPNGSMGIAAGDYDRSGLPSLLVTNFQNQNHCLYRNLGNGQFQHAEQAAGLLELGQDYVGFGAGFFDFDLDGAEDVFIANGHVLLHPKPPSTPKQRPVLLRNLFKPGTKPGQTRFENVTDRGGTYFRKDHMGRGVAFGDLDNDGGMDLVISHINEPVTLLRNRAARGHWLGIELVDKEGRDPVGAKLSLDVDGQTLTRFAVSGGSYLSANDRRHLFGLGKAAQLQKLTVRWPSGRVESWNGAALAIDRYHKIIEGKGGEP